VNNSTLSPKKARQRPTFFEIPDKSGVEYLILQFACFQGPALETSPSK